MSKVPVVRLMFPTRKIGRMKYRFTEKKVQERSVVGLDYEEKHFFGRDIEQSRANDNVRRVSPDSLADEVGIPRNS